MMKKITLINLALLLLFINQLSVFGQTVEANFNANPITVEVYMEVYFTDLSTGNPNSWEWDFQNDGIIDSYEQNPIYYTSDNDEGYLTVSLTVSDGITSDTEIKVNYITVIVFVPAEADFIADQTVVNFGDPVFFTDLSIGPPEIWEWDFDADGVVDSYEQNPQWIYNIPGVYTVSLFVENIYGSNTEIKTDYIIVEDITLPMQVDFSADQTYVSTGTSIQFTDMTTGLPESWAWDFQNDGVIDSYEQNPHWIYNSSGVYTVSLTAVDVLESINEIKFDYITVTSSLTQDIVAYYPFDDGTATDMTGNGHDGSINGSVPMTDWQNGKYVTFNGDYNNFIEIPHHNDLNFSGSFTISVWIKKLGAGTVSAHVITKGRDISSTYTIYAGGRTFRFAEGNGGTTSSAGVGDAEFPLNVWHYVTCVVNNEDQTTSYYLNGVLKDQNPIAQSFNITTTYPLVFGRHFTVPSGGSSWPYPCHASIDEVRIYSKALTETEIQELYKLNALATTWTGLASSEWNDTGNWDNGIPNSSINVIIPTGLTNYPTLAAIGECNNLTLDSDANGSATILDNGFLTVHGTTNVERYFSGNDLDWHLVSSPVSNATAGVFTGMYLQSFDESDYSWDEITNIGTSLSVLEGYGLYSTMGATNTVTFTGNLNTGPQSASFNLGDDSYNWNLMGNPYPSSIDWEAVTIPSGMKNEVHYIRASDGNDLVYVQGTGGTGSQYIPPHQGFFVSATSSGFLTFDDTDRSHMGANNFYKSDNPNLLVLQASGENYSDETWVHFNELASKEHDGIYDAYKRISLSNPELPQLFSVTPQNNYLSVNGLPETETVTIGFTAVNSGTFTISAKQLMESTDIIIEDKVSNETTDLNVDSYSFCYSAGENLDRFVLHFTPLAVGQISMEKIKIYSFGKDVYVNIPAATHSKISIYNISSQMIASQSTDKSFNKLRLNCPGCYIVKVQSDQNVVTKKVFVK